MAKTQGSVRYRTQRRRTEFPNHSHNVDKIDAVLTGRFLIVLDGEQLELGPGDCVWVPRGRTHSAAVLGKETVISIDAIKRRI